MTDFPKNGFAAKLLDRAAGLAGSLRPRITPYFSTPETAADPLIEERATERPAPSHEPQARFDNSPQQQAEEKPQTRFTGPEPKSESERQIAEPRLMPPVAPGRDDLAPQSAATRPRPDDPSQPVLNRAPPEAPVPERQISPRPSEEKDADMSAPRISGSSPSRLREKVPVPDLKSVLAAAVARLTPSPERKEEAALMPRNEVERVITATPPPGAPEAPAPQKDMSSEATAPLQIHIGEIVIAPDPQHQSASQVANTPQQAEWKPTLTLDDYRERRGKEWT